MTPEPPATWDDARLSLQVVIRRGSAPHNQLVAFQRGPEHALVTHPFGPVLHRCLVVDTPHLRMFVKPRHLARWGVSASTAWLQASVNMPPVSAVDTDGPVWSFSGQESASFLLSSAWVQRVTREIGGPCLLAIPQPNRLLATTAQHANRLLEAAEHAMKGSSAPITCALFDGADLPNTWVPAKGHPMRSRQRQAFSRTVGQIYSEQQEQIVAHWTDPQDLRVPSVSVCHRDGEWWTRCEWRPEVRTLLPRVDQVDIVTSDGTISQVGAALLRDLNPPLVPGLHPVRYLIDATEQAGDPLDLPGVPSR